MSLYNTFQSAGDKLTEGVWVDYGDQRVKIRYAGRENKLYVKTLRALTAPYGRILGNDNVNMDAATDRKMNAIFAEVYAKSVLADWENMLDKNGEPLPFTWENAKQVLIDLPLFFDEVKAVAGSMQAFRDKELEDESKNS